MPLRDLTTRVLEQPRFRTILLTAFAATALLLAAFGVFGVLSYTVSQRTSEIGIRMALGAGRQTVRGMIVGEVMRFALVGVACGLVTSESGNHKPDQGYGAS